MQEHSHAQRDPMLEPLRILQLNIWKSRACMEALINDQDTEKLDILLIQEPPVSFFKTFVQHRAWQLYTPTYTGDKRRRAALYINKRFSTSAQQQIQCNGPDVTAVRLETPTGAILVFSVYVPPIGSTRRSAEEEMQSVLTAIQTTLNEQGPADNMGVIIAGDFNRQDPLWGGDLIRPHLVGDAASLIAFMQEHRLQSHLRRGTPTYWSVNKPGSRTTLDLTLSNIVNQFTKCELYPQSYGSDHRALYSEWNLEVETKAGRPLRKMYDRTDWIKVGQTIQGALTPIGAIQSREQLDSAVEQLVSTTAVTVNKLTPTARACPYSKHWFNPELKEQQSEHNRLRRFWQACCSGRGRDDPFTQSQFAAMQKSRRKWVRAVEQAKSAHWRDYLDRAGDGNTLWKAAKYVNPDDSYCSIPPLSSTNGQVTSNEGKAQLLLDTFFPKAVDPLGDLRPSIEPPLAWQPITEAEIHRSLVTTKANSAPGADGLPTLVWQKLWPYVAKTIHQIFNASLDLGYHPKAWRTAAIVVLRKPGKPDYTIPKAYRPISLLNTLGKLLEAVVAKRLSFYAEKYNLLPDTQYGARPGRSTEQALLILVNAIWTAWRDHKVLTLMAFDLKGAFNAVNKDVLDHCLGQRRVPLQARTWIESFMENRSASVHLDRYIKPATELQYPGLPQGSPLSPILFAFFNAKLVDQPVDSSGGSSAYIDDYFRWRTSFSAQKNLRNIQREDVPRIECWARETGSTFEADKTELIHFTRNKEQQCPATVTMGPHEIKPSETVKLLGVIFDQELRWRAHVQRAVKRATKTCLAIGRLQHLRPKQMRQLYQACVIPQMDYASTVWHSPKRCKWQVSVLSRIQRIATIRAISAFRTVATETLDVENFLLPTKLRLQARAARVITNLRGLPAVHPARKLIQRTIQNLEQVTGFVNPLCAILKTYSRDQYEEVETIDSCPLPPWQPSPLSSILTHLPKDNSQKSGNQPTNIELSTAVFADASKIDGNLGAAAAMLNQANEVHRSSVVGVGSAKAYTIHAAELIAISTGMQLAAEQQLAKDNPKPQVYTIYSDSKAALQALVSYHKKRSGQSIVRSIILTAQFLKESLQISFSLQWIPSHSGIRGNEEADRLARTATKRLREHSFQPLIPLQVQAAKEATYRRWRSEWWASEKGQHLRSIDTATPGPHVRNLYDKLPRSLAGLLAQLRTGHCWLNQHRKRMGRIDNDRCECGETESVSHVILECPLLQEDRQKLQQETGLKTITLSALLGGKGPDRTRLTKDDEYSKWGTSTAQLKAVLEFARQSKRFLNRDETRE
jgi:ribonuclease HI